MPLSVVDLYKDVLAKTNCQECGEKTCMVFATQVSKLFRDPGLTLIS